MPLRTVPPNASVVSDQEGKLFAPSAYRNQFVISQLLQSLAPPAGDALEIASGTGQHIVHFAQSLPKLSWQPSDVDAERCRSIDAYIAESGLSNIKPAMYLDATTAGWAKSMPPLSMIALVNLLHLVSDTEAQILLNEAASALSASGVFMIYGPFSRDGVLTSDGDKSFDASLRVFDPLIGYKDTVQITKMAEDAGLYVTATHDMPSNNLALILKKQTD